MSEVDLQHDGSRPRARGRIGDLRTLAAFALLAWCGWAFAANAWTELQGWRGRAGATTTPTYLWRFGTPPVEELRRCAEETVAAVPGGALVALDDPTGDMFRYRWTAYFLANLDVVSPPPAELPVYAVLAFAPPRRASAGVPLVARPGCYVYRMR